MRKLLKTYCQKELNLDFLCGLSPGGSFLRFCFCSYPIAREDTEGSSSVIFQFLQEEQKAHVVSLKPPYHLGRTIKTCSDQEKNTLLEVRQYPAGVSKVWYLSSQRDYTDFSNVYTHGTPLNDTVIPRYALTKRSHLYIFYLEISWLQFHHIYSKTFAP